MSYPRGIAPDIKLNSDEEFLTIDEEEKEEVKVKTEVSRIVLAPNPCLNRKAVNVKKVNDLDVKKVIYFLTKELTSNTYAVGLAANQIGSNKNIFVFKRQVSEAERALNLEMVQVIINAKIIQTSKDMVPSLEGCLSYPGIERQVTRHARITVSYRNQNGRHMMSILDGENSKIWQHEIEHLNGGNFTQATLWSIYQLEQKALKQEVK